jgi:uncharacterized protein (DUF2141 family)
MSRRHRSRLSARSVKLIALLVMPLMATPAYAGELRVIIEGIESPAGTIVAGLYDNAESYDSAVGESSKVLVNDSTRLVGVSLRPSGRTQRIAFPDLRPGLYAVVIFHDENDDSKLDKNALGLPTEGYAMSNNARGLMSAPAFRDTAVRIGDRDEVIRIKLVYPRRLSERPEPQQSVSESADGGASDGDGADGR